MFLGSCKLSRTAWNFKNEKVLVHGNHTKIIWNENNFILKIKFVFLAYFVWVINIYFENNILS